MNGASAPNIINVLPVQVSSANAVPSTTTSAAATAAAVALSSSGITVTPIMQLQPQPQPQQLSVSAQLHQPSKIISQPSIIENATQQQQQLQQHSIQPDESQKIEALFTTATPSSSAPAAQQPAHVFLSGVNTSIQPQPSKRVYTTSGSNDSNTFQISENPPKRQKLSQSVTIPIQPSTVYTTTNAPPPPPPPSTTTVTQNDRIEAIQSSQLPQQPSQLSQSASSIVNSNIPITVGITKSNVTGTEPATIITENINPSTTTTTNNNISNILINSNIPTNIGNFNDEEDDEYEEEEEEEERGRNNNTNNNTFVSQQAAVINEGDVENDTSLMKISSGINGITNSFNGQLVENDGNQQFDLQIERISGNQVAPAAVSEQKYVDITEYLTLPQNTAALKVGLPPSTFSKRWREAACGRKWPYRTVAKIDKEILTLIHNIPPNQVSLPEEMESTLKALAKRRNDELKPVWIRI